MQQDDTVAPLQPHGQALPAAIQGGLPHMRRLTRTSGDRTLGDTPMQLPDHPPAARALTCG